MFSKKLRSFALPLIILLIVIIGLTGCGTSSMKTQSNTPTSGSPADQAASNSNNTSTPSSTAPTQAVKMTLYFPAPDASGLVAVERTVNVNAGETVQALFKELSNPPSGLDNPIPKGTELLGATVKDGVLSLNLSKQFKENFGGGETGEQMILYSIVDSMTSLPNIKSVEFLLDGKQTAAILGALDTSTPLKRNESLIRK